MTKESKIRGKIFLPKYIKENPKVRQIFKAEKRRRHVHRELPPTEYDIANRSLYANEIKVKLEAQRARRLSTSFQQFKQENGIS